MIRVRAASSLRRRRCAALVGVTVTAALWLAGTGTSSATVPTYTVSASTTAISQGQSVTFTSTAPGDTYAQVFVNYSQVGSGRLDSLLGAYTWDQYRYTNWYSACEAGTLSLRIYGITVDQTSEYFIGTLMWNQVIDGVPTVDDVTVDLLADPVCPNDTTTTTAGTGTTTLVGGTSGGDALLSGQSGRNITSTGSSSDVLAMLALVVFGAGVAVVMSVTRPTRLDLLSLLSAKPRR